MAELRPATTDRIFRVMNLLRDLVEDESELLELVRNLQVHLNDVDCRTGN